MLDATAPPARPNLPALRADPRFPAAARQAAAGIVATYRGSAVMNRLLNDRGRFLLSLLALALHLEPPGGGRDGLTAGRLKAEAAALGICSPGRAGAVLAAFRLLGLVEAVPMPDRRLKRLAATPRFVDMHRRRWRALLEPMAAFMPEGAAGLAGLDDPAFLPLYVEALLSPFRAGWRLLDEVPVLAPFADRDAGIVIALSLMGTAEDGTPPPIAHLARQFGVSRSHVLGMLRAGEEAGLLHRPDPRGGAVAAPALEEALRDFIACAFLMQAQAVRRAGMARG
ncbi:hypothetical protein [Ancylobacter oerskovii]|uniref:MarR family transcriptional regulator n=1 Tax=Ancylobacter oerskovii TaxID=459519 RepID=A0ABW4Z2F4_9HYPH|nr:hypothetical protein [Ancylobacter oerskovii]MBS7544791.1 hypothetical protein [Ancylobacter oerskovii]